MLTALMIIGQVDAYLDVWDRMETQTARKLPAQAISYVYKFVEIEINRAVYSGVEEHVSNQLKEEARAY